MKTVAMLDLFCKAFGPNLGPTFLHCLPKIKVAGTCQLYFQSPHMPSCSGA